MVSKRITNVLLSLCTITALFVGGFSIAQAEETNKSVLTFTFNSPDQPWTDTEKSFLQKAVNDFYPVIESVVGSPAYTMTIDIVHNNNLGSPAMTSKCFLDGKLSMTIALNDVTKITSLCHEIIHAFQGDCDPKIASFVEGMTRAAEIEIFNRLAAYSDIQNGNLFHNYELDVYYEALNEHILGGNVFDGYVSAFLRYQLCGYAWGKLVLENPEFFVKFNNELYRRCKTDKSFLSSEESLISIIESIQPTVESTPFRSWYKRQGCLNLNPPKGNFIYNRINQYTIDCFTRCEDNNVVMNKNVPVTWTIYDYSNRKLYEGSDMTNDYGIVDSSPYSLASLDYTGRIKLVASTNQFPDEKVTDTSLRIRGNSLEKGIFGILPSSNTGTVTFYQNDTQIGSANVTNGAFSDPKLEKVKGKIKAVYDDGNGQRFTKYFTKDASIYYVFMAPNTPTGLTAVRDEIGNIDLKWDSVENATSYNIKRSKSPGGEYTTIASNITETSYIDSKVFATQDDRTSYYYVVTAVSAGNESADSCPQEVIYNKKIATTTNLTYEIEVHDDLTLNASVIADDGSICEGLVAFMHGNGYKIVKNLVNGKAKVTGIDSNAYPVIVEYLGNSYYSGSSDQIDKTATSTSLRNYYSPSSGDQTVTFIATVTTSNGLTPIGYVHFMEGETQLVRVRLSDSGNGTATAQAVINLPIGVHSVKALFMGHVALSASESSPNQIEIKAVEAKNKISGYIKPDFEMKDYSGFKVEVVGASFSTITTLNGYFEFKGIPEDSTEYTLKICKRGYLTREVKGLKLNSDVQISTDSAPTEVWFGDINQDGTINMADIVAITKAFNATSSDENYNVLYDVNGDGTVNMADIIPIAKHFNEISADYPI